MMLKPHRKLRDFQLNLSSHSHFYREEFCVFLEYYRGFPNTAQNQQELITTISCQTYLHLGNLLLTLLQRSAACGSLSQGANL